MSYSVFILPRAKKEFSALPKPEYEKVKQAMLALDTNPRPANCSKLTGRDGWRIRVGNYRLIYTIDDKARIVTVLHIGHRRDVYR